MAFENDHDATLSAGTAAGTAADGAARPAVRRADAEAMDATDPLAQVRDEFVIADPHLVYLDGNSLGRTPKRTVARLAEVVHHEWASQLILSWGAGPTSWVTLPLRVGDRLAPLIGAGPGEVAVHDSTTVNLYQLVHAAVALRPDRRVIVVDEGEFPTDRYVVDGIAAVTGHEVRLGVDGAGGLDDVAVVVRSVIDYRSALRADVAADTARVHAHGALVIWDLSHAAGAVEIDLHAAGVQLAVGCTYKFLNGGPGAPAFTYVATDLQGHLPQPIWGWFAQRDQFTMGPDFAPQPDIRRVLLGTPSILSLAAAEEGIALSAEVGMAAIAAKGRALTTLALDLCDQFGLRTSTPRDPARRGAHVAVHHPRAAELVQALASRGVITDLRMPDIVRVGCSPLTTRFVDVWDGLHALATLS